LEIFVFVHNGLQVAQIVYTKTQNNGSTINGTKLGLGI